LSNYNRMSDQLKSVVIALAAIAATLVLAKLLDLWLAHRKLPPEAATRWATLRRVLLATVVTIGVLAALLTIPEIRAFSAAILASGAVLGIIVGMAAQPTLGNAISGLLIAFAQPLRLHDHLEFAGLEGVVEEIGLTYTFIRTDDRRRLVVPNSKLASDTIVNASIRSRETFAEVSVPVPLKVDLDAALDALREDVADERDASVYVSSLEDPATLTLRAAASDALQAEHLEHELRLRAHRRLRALGVWT
jgi:small-conductance mechanosensitive channel